MLLSSAADRLTRPEPAEILNTSKATPVAINPPNPVWGGPFEGSPVLLVVDGSGREVGFPGHRHRHAVQNC
jgi:hypothetical protein